MPISSLRYSVNHFETGMCVSSVIDIGCRVSRTRRALLWPRPPPKGVLIRGYLYLYLASISDSTLRDS